jgi:hypothetical protein
MYFIILVVMDEIVDFGENKKKLSRFSKLSKAATFSQYS